MPAEPEPANRPGAVQMVLDAFPGAVELGGDAIGPSATFCLPCYERRRAEGRH